jgi:hypothetical protein
MWTMVSWGHSASETRRLPGSDLASNDRLIASSTRRLIADVARQDGPVVPRRGRAKHGKKARQSNAPPPKISARITIIMAMTTRCRKRRKSVGLQRPTGNKRKIGHVNRSQPVVAKRWSTSFMS